MVDEFTELSDLHVNIQSNAEAKRLKEGLLRQQRTLYEALLQKDARLAPMYLGALSTLDNNSNPDRLPQAAHSIRELMEKIPELLDVSIEAQRESLKPKVVELGDTWQGVVKNTKCYNSRTWSGEIDGPLRKLLKKLDEFFEWFAEHHPRRKAEFAKTLRALDESGFSLPEPLEALNVEQWVKIRDFFQSIAHHRYSPSIEEFNKWLGALERFLLDRLVPRTFTDFNVIDRIIQEAEKDA